MATWSRTADWGAESHSKNTAVRVPGKEHGAYQLPPATTRLLEAAHQENARLRGELEVMSQQLSESMSSRSKLIDDLYTENDALKVQIDRLTKGCEDSEHHREEARNLRKKLAATQLNLSETRQELEAASVVASSQDDELGPECEFGRRVFQCLIDNKGVGYRFSPNFSDKNPDGCGPITPQVIVADKMAHGPHAIFVRCVSGRGWLPLTNQSGQTRCFEHLGREEDVNLSHYELSQGRNKLNGDWFQSKQS
eukprot:TRINITY_DN12536_c0_g1_i2.p1 TRINITY_DN12536_c0_g1~~TRINITY_DN12536_c0_g1_i2.p1  ORF type:complete len:252 (-),score=52.44 TRINITY_DN12536_c0_g1_i2:389-1144(-)